MPTWSYIHLSIHPPIDLVYLNYRFYLRGAIQSVVSADAMQFSVQPASVHPLMLFYLSAPGQFLASWPSHQTPTSPNKKRRKDGKFDGTS